MAVSSINMWAYTYVEHVVMSVKECVTRSDGDVYFKYVMLLKAEHRIKAAGRCAMSNQEKYIVCILWGVKSDGAAFKTCTHCTCDALSMYCCLWNTERHFVTASTCGTYIMSVYMLLPYVCCFMSFLLPSMFSIPLLSILCCHFPLILFSPPLPSPPLCRMSPCRTWPQCCPEQAARRTSQN